MHLKVVCTNVICIIVEMQFWEQENAKCKLKK